MSSLFSRLIEIADRGEVGLRAEEDLEPMVRGQDREKGKKKKRKSHIHIGPNVRAFRAGRAFCPTCSADRVLRLTEEERQVERAAREAQKASRRRLDRAIDVPPED